MNSFWITSLKVTESQQKSQKVNKGDTSALPLTEKVAFKAMLQTGNRIQIPKIIRWQYKLEPNQTLKATVTITQLIKIQETFYTKITKDGRILIPKLILELIGKREIELTHHVLEISIEPM